MKEVNPILIQLLTPAQNPEHFSVKEVITTEISF